MNWLNGEKLSNPVIEAEILKALRISPSTLAKILYLEGYVPNPQIRLLLAQFTGLDENELFPVIEQEAA